MCEESRLTNWMVKNMFSFEGMNPYLFVCKWNAEMFVTQTTRTDGGLDLKELSKIDGSHKML